MNNLVQVKFNVKNNVNEENNIHNLYSKCQGKSFKKENNIYSFCINNRKRDISKLIRNINNVKNYQYIKLDNINLQVNKDDLNKLTNSKHFANNKYKIGLSDMTGGTSGAEIKKIVKLILKVPTNKTFQNIYSGIIDFLAHGRFIEKGSELTIKFNKIVGSKFSLRQKVLVVEQMMKQLQNCEGVKEEWVITYSPDVDKMNNNSENEMIIKKIGKGSSEGSLIPEFKTDLKIINYCNDKKILSNYLLDLLGDEISYNLSFKNQKPTYTHADLYSFAKKILAFDGNSIWDDTEKDRRNNIFDTIFSNQKGLMEEEQLEKEQLEKEQLEKEQLEKDVQGGGHIPKQSILKSIVLYNKN